LQGLNCEAAGEAGVTEVGAGWDLDTLHVEKALVLAKLQVTKMMTLWHLLEYSVVESGQDIPHCSFYNKVYYKKL
jgi:hypothetical protein